MKIRPVKVNSKNCFNRNYKLDDLLRKHEIAHLIISVQNLSTSKKKILVDSCLNYQTKVLNVPPVSNWINGELSFKQIKKIKKIKDKKLTKKIFMSEMIQNQNPIK